MAKDLKYNHKDLSFKAFFKIIIIYCYYLFFVAVFPCSFLHTRTMRLLRRDISITLTEPNTEEQQVPAVLSLVLALVARELPDILNLAL